MRTQLIAAAFAGLFAVTPSLAQTTAPASDKAETSCNTTSSAATSGNAGKTTGTSTGIEKSAVLPSAGGHASSAAPTVQSDGKPMEVRPDCPPETKK
jgi:uncharacterized membrane protein